MQPAVIALDLGGTKLASALIGPDGRVIGKRSAQLGQRGGSDVGELIVRDIARLQRLAAKQDRRVRGIGVCVPGIAKPKTGRVWAPNIQGWEDYPLRSQIATTFPSKIHIMLESDRAASILGEAWLGAARGCRDAVFLAVGTGIGAGILADGRVVRGAQGIAGAIGWLALERPFCPEFVECGCFESRASGNGIAQTARELLTRRKNHRGPLRATAELTARDVFAAFEQGDEIAREALQQAIALWGMAVANLVSIFNPERVIFGGGVFGPAVQFLDAIASEARRWAQPVAIQNITLEASHLGPRAALYGAGYLALKRARLLKRTSNDE